MKRLIQFSFASISLALFGPQASATTYSADIVVYGATSGGIMSAIQAVKEGKTVELVEPTAHIGGMTTGGLGWVDGGILSTIGGMSRDFFDAVTQSSPSTPPGFSSGSNPWTLLPSDALAEFQSLLDLYGITVRTGNRLILNGGGVFKSGLSITEIHMENGNVFQGQVFIDATYEGDLMAEAGVSYRVGRESSSEYGEALAGVVGPDVWQPQQFDYFIDPYVTPGDPSSGLLPYIQEGPLEDPGTGDDKTQAYCFRLCLTRSTAPSDRVEITQPAGYDPSKFEILRRYIAARPSTVLEDHLLKISPLHDGKKTDVNNRGPFSLDHIGQNWDYPDGDYITREAIWQEHVDFTKGLLWFLKSDNAVPSSVRSAMAAFAYPADEYTTNGNFSPQLYVREARRMVGPYVMTEADIEVDDTKTDAIGQASYGVDSHHVQRLIFPVDYPASPASRNDTQPYDRNSSGQLQNEGNFLAEQHAYDIPYRAITPSKSECDNLLVTFCVSASHIAFGSMRMEPVFMHLGQSAATAASQAIDQGVAVQDIDYQTLRAKLKADGQVFSDAGEPPVVITEFFNGYGSTNLDIGGLKGGTGWGGAWGLDDGEYEAGTQLIYSAQDALYDNSGNQNDADDGRVRWTSTDGGAIIPRPFARSLDGTVWISALVRMTGNDRAFIWLDSDEDVSGGNSGTFFGIDDHGGGSLTIRFNDTTSPYDQVFVEETIPLNTTHLFLAKVEVDYSGSDDRVSFWFNPDLSGGEAGLGTPDILSTHIATGDALGIALDGIAIQLVDRDTDGAGSIMDALRISNLPTAFHDVTAPPAETPDISTIPTAASVVNVSGNDYLAFTYEQPEGGNGTIGIDYAAAGFLYTVEYDNDLDGPWSMGDITLLSVIGNGNGTETVTVRLNSPVTVAGKQFIRLNVSPAP